VPSLCDVVLVPLYPLIALKLVELFIAVILNCSESIVTILPTDKLAVEATLNVTELSSAIAPAIAVTGSVLRPVAVKQFDVSSIKDRHVERPWTSDVLRSSTLNNVS